MELGWVQDSFHKNDGKIAGSYKAYKKYIIYNVIPKENLSTIQLDLYSKDNGNVYRMIVGLCDINKKTIQIKDGLVEAKQIQNINFLSNEFTTLKEITENDDLKNTVLTDLEMMLYFTNLNLLNQLKKSFIWWSLEANQIWWNLMQKKMRWLRFIHMIFNCNSLNKW